MTDMIERVARAICRELGMNPDQEHYAGLSDQIGREWEQFVGAARAAIEAMREPTEFRRWGPLMRACIAEWKRRTGNAECRLSPPEFAREMDALCGLEHQNGPPEECAQRWLDALKARDANGQS